MGIDKVQGMLMGLTVGDVLGLPFETWTTEKILEFNSDGIRDYYEPTHNPYYKDGKIGEYSDDTQLSFAVVNALLRSKSFDMVTIAEEHIVELHKSTNGWGNSTREGKRQIR